MLVSCAALPEILAYDGDHGMAGALRSLGDRCATVPVEDPGILVTVHDADDLDPRLKTHNEQLVRPVVRVSLERESSFFDERTRLLLYLVDDTRSLRAACDLMALSYAKGRALVNELEDVLGEKVLERRRGGRDGGSSTLTPEARDFLERYQQLDEHATRSAQELFARLFPRLGRGA